MKSKSAIIKALLISSFALSGSPIAKADEVASATPSITKNELCEDTGSNLNWGKIFTAPRSIEFNHDNLVCFC